LTTLHGVTSLLLLLLLLPLTITGGHALHGSADDVSVLVAFAYTSEQDFNFRNYVAQCCGTEYTERMYVVRIVRT